MCAKWLKNLGNREWDTDETRALFPDVPFQQMRGMRNIIAHVYGEVDLTIVWRTVREHLPGLIAHVAGHPSEADRVLLCDTTEQRSKVAAAGSEGTLG